jgi:four helix bundle protein
LQFISIAEGSLTELQSHLFVALDIEYISGDKFSVLFNQAEEVQRILNGLAEYLRTAEQKGIKYRN